MGGRALDVDAGVRKEEVRRERLDDAAVGTQLQWEGVRLVQPGDAALVEELRQLQLRGMGETGRLRSPEMPEARHGERLPAIARLRTGLDDFPKISKQIPNQPPAAASHRDIPIDTRPGVSATR
jgi:hypothetical protein